MKLLLLQYMLNYAETLKSSLSRGILRKRCSENMQQIYRTRILKCNFNKVAKQLY